MKGLVCALWTLILLSACAAGPQEIPQDVSALEPAFQEPERTELEFSPVNPNPVEYVSMQLGKRRVYGESLIMPAAPFLENDAFYFPLQFLAEAMGVQYAYADGCAYLQCDGHITQFFIDSTRFVVDGVEGRAEGERTLFREDLPQAPVDERFTPLLRDGIVFLPVDFLPPQFRMPYNSFGAQMSFVNDGSWVHFYNDRLPATNTGFAHAVTLCPDVAEALVDGVRTPLPAAPFVENGIFYFPVEKIAEFLGFDYSRTGDSFRLSDSRHNVQLFLNSRKYILNGRSGRREYMRNVFGPGNSCVPVDDNYVPVERGGVVFLPYDYFMRIECPFLWPDEYGFEKGPTVIFSSGRMEEHGIGGFYLQHKFDDTPPELRAGLHCIGKISEYEGEYDVIVYTGDGLFVHVLRHQPGTHNALSMDGTIVAVSTSNPKFSTPRGLRCGDSPRRAWELYGYDFAYLFRYTCPNNGPITAIGFVSYKVENMYIYPSTPYIPIAPDEWFDMPAFWETEVQP